MPGILANIAAQGFSCLPCYRMNLDQERFSEYRDSDEHPAAARFENPPLPKDKRAIPEVASEVSSILQFFLDGSRRTYKVADIIINGRYLPLIAAQVGVAALGRDVAAGRVAPLRDVCHLTNVVAFPDKANEDELKELEAKVNARNGPSFRVLRYKVKEDRDPVDLGIAIIMRFMQDLEVDAVNHLSSQHLLQNDALLVVDGPLRFKEMKGRKFDVVSFRNVFGLSKTFRPSFTVGKGRQRADIGAVTSDLEFRERTPVFKTVDEKRTIGMWYLRLRPRQMMTDPLQGVVKLECYAMDEEERENGLDADRVDVISAHLLRERNVTPYGADWRWANHVYPVYLAESYIKSSFMSDAQFLRQHDFPVEVRDITFYPEDATPDSPFWIWYARTDLLGMIDDEQVAGFRIRKNNFALGGPEAVAELFGRVAPSNKRFNAYYLGEIHVLDADAIPNARRDGFEELEPWPTIRDSLLAFIRARCDEVRSTSEARNRPTAKVVAALQDVLVPAKQQLQTGFVSLDQRDELVEKVVREESRAAKALSARSVPTDAELIAPMVADLRQTREAIEKTTKLGVNALRASLDRKQKKLLAEVLHILRDTLDPQQFQKAQTAILARFGESGTGSDR